MSPSSIDELGAEVKAPQGEVRTVERAGPTFDERRPTVEAELVEAEAVFRRLGPQLGGFVSELPEHVYERRQAMVGMAIVANKKALLDAERQRVKAATEGLSSADKARRLDQLRAAVLRAAAKRELLVREREVAGEFQLRPVHPEFVIFQRADLEQLAR